MDKTARTWIKARDIIANALCEFDKQSLIVAVDFHDHAAAAIIARLAAADPPLLICEPDELKEKDDGR